MNLVEFNISKNRAYLALYPGGTSSLKQTTAPLAAYSSRTVSIYVNECTSLLCTTSDQVYPPPKLSLRFVQFVKLGESQPITVHITSLYNLTTEKAKYGKSPFKFANV